MWAWFTAWIQSLGFVTQSAHFFSGMAVVLAASLWLYPPLAAGLFLGVWAVPKEVLFDALPWGEDHGKPDWLDLTFYCLGAGGALAFLKVAGQW